MCLPHLPWAFTICSLCSCCVLPMCSPAVCFLSVSTVCAPCGPCVFTMHLCVPSVFTMSALTQSLVASWAQNTNWMFIMWFQCDCRVFPMSSSNVSFVFTMFSHVFPCVQHVFTRCLLCVQILVVGPPGCGKSECIKTFAVAEKERGKIINIQSVFTKAVESQELMGYVDPKTKYNHKFKIGSWTLF